jgi:glycosyltransferase involved in cell wall biosynthesis
MPSDLDRAWLDERDPHTAALAASDAASDDSPLGLAFTTARAKVQGLRIFLDGSSLGPLETGTQVGVVQLAERLAERDDVSSVTIGLFGEVPAYAAHLTSTPKVEVRHTPPRSDLTPLGRFDVAFRPNQPDVLYDVEQQRVIAARVVVSILDLIAYAIGGYQRTPEEWLAYRGILRDRVGRVDGVTTISVDVKDALVREQLPIDPDRVFAIPYGTQHLAGAEELRAPASITWRDRVARPFVLCLGTNYSHKNRDLAVRAHAELVRRGRLIDLVLVGASVPFGSSRIAEEDALLEVEAAAGDAAVLTVPDVPAAERNWLFSHAEVLLYPTSAEGFGLVPYEAAAFGTPSVYVPFGPLQEIGGDVPVVAADWRPASFADAIERLLDDPALAEAQVAALAAKASTYSWDRTAEDLVRAFRQLLSLPARSHP